MIEDRKFGQEITDEYKPFDWPTTITASRRRFVYLKNSPWKVIGPKGTVTMDKSQRLRRGMVADDSSAGRWNRSGNFAGQ